MPAPIRVDNAVKFTLSASIGHNFLLDVSDCGMLQIIMGECAFPLPPNNPFPRRPLRYLYLWFFEIYTMYSLPLLGLHVVLFRIMEESGEFEDSLPAPGDRSSNLEAYPKLCPLVYCAVITDDVENLANEVVNNHGSDSMKRANNALNAWRKNWDDRKIRDIHQDDDTTSAFTHPLNFWVLAKLFIILHFFRNRVISGQDGSDGIGGERTAEEQRSELLTYYRAKGGSTSEKLAVQVQIIGWLAKIRQQSDKHALGTESFLSQVLSI